MKNNTNAINMRIATYRRLAGLTQAEAAAALGMKRNTYGRMELHGNPKPEMLIKIAKLYNVSVNELLYGVDESRSHAIENRKQPEGFYVDPDGSSTTAVFHEEISPALEPVRFIPTVSEINLIKIYRFMTKDQQRQVRQLMEELYQSSKGSNG